MLKIYGSKLCPDCVQCLEDLRRAEVSFTYFDFSDGLEHLKEFLKIRDSYPEFAEIREAGKIGIPCLVREDGSITLNWDCFL